MKKLFIIAVILRLGMYFVFSYYYPENFTHKESDAKYYYETSFNLQVPAIHKEIIGEYKWYERVAVYVYYLHITQREIIIQILLSCLTVLVVCKINHVAGWLWCFYPQAIILSFQTNKESLLFLVLAFLFLIIYKLKEGAKKQILIFSAVIFCIMVFNSYSGVLDFNLHRNNAFGFMQNFWELWKPSFAVSSEYSEIWNYVQIIPYICLIFFFLRRVKILSAEFILFVVISLTYSIIHGGSRLREPFMMALIIWIGRYLTEAREIGKKFNKIEKEGKNVR